MKKFLVMAVMAGFASLVVACNDKKSEEKMSQIPATQEETKPAETTNGDEGVIKDAQQEEADSTKSANGEEHKTENIQQDESKISE